MERADRQPGGRDDVRSSRWSLVVGRLPVLGCWPAGERGGFAVRLEFRLASQERCCMLRRAVSVGLIVVAVCALAPAQKKAKKPNFPKLIVTARYVLVTSWYGDQYQMRIPPEDRQAINNVQEAVQKWGRYTLVYKPEDADLIFVVRKGRVASLTGGVRLGAGSEGAGVGSIAGTEMGNPGDTLLVYDARSPGGADKPALWKSIERGGLEPPEMRAIAKLRKEVEEAAKP